MRLNRFALFTWGVLFYNILVILWGAYVRATGSGAGCGSHWPLCNGVVIPRAEQLETAIEFTHRVTSGIAFILVVILFIWTRRVFGKGSAVRLGANLSLFFIVTESLLGAGLVLFEWVASDASTGRVISIALHLVNTFLLLAAITLTGWWASGGEPLRLRDRGILLWLVVIALAGVIVLGVSGAITALGDTLFPSASLAEGIQQDFSPSAHFVIRLRVWHPILAILVGLFLFFLSGLVGMFSRVDNRLPASDQNQRPTHTGLIPKQVQAASAALVGIVLLQLFAGLINLVLLAPVWMQIIHLLLADLVWITLVLLSAILMSDQRVDQEVVQVNHLPAGVLPQPKVSQISRVIE
jgi:heme A synthase